MPLPFVQVDAVSVGPGKDLDTGDQNTRGPGSTEKLVSGKEDAVLVSEIGFTRV